MIKRISSNFVEWCVEVLDSDNYVILDTETTGLDKSDQILELAIIGTSCEVLYNELLRPSCPIGEGAMSVHHITEDMVAQARTFLEAWPDIALSISGRSLITWNAAFDARMLVQTATLHKIVLKDIDFHCCMQEYARYYNFARWQSLTAACSQQRIAFNTNHRALGDCFMVLDIIRAIAEKARPVSDPSVTLETKARFQSSDLVPLDLKNWDGVRKALEG